MKSQRQKVFVGLSGGVDSSVSAALLKKAATPRDFKKIFGRPSPEGFRGYDVTGVFIRVWSPASSRSDLSPDLRSDLFGACQAADDRLDAMRVCAKLGIPFVELDLEKEYKREVVDYMIREYRAGRTPNPDVFCNRFIKFGAFYRWARANGADFVATGHYARVSRTLPKGEIPNQSRIRKLSAISYQLKAGLDPQKDQSYFLWQIRREQLPHILFPVGGMKKPDVRRLARKFGLITAEKKDSQGLCFVGKVDMKEFLTHYIKPKKGKVLDEEGKIIGEHNGFELYTLGERWEGGVANTYGRRYLPPYQKCYVISKDSRRNTLTVSHKTPSGDLPLARKEVVIKDCNWLVGPEVGKTYHARVRYRQAMQTCTLINADITWMNADRNLRTSALSSARIRVRFESPQNAVAGQSLVLYDGDVLVGGGIIEEARN